LGGKVKFLQENVSVLSRSAFDFGNLPFSKKLQEKKKLSNLPGHGPTL
jgi:hypothetical protein